NRIGAANNYTLQIFSCLATNIAADIWSQQTPGSTTGHIWADIGVPTGFDVATINASLAFIGVRAFALFTGRATTTGQWRLGIVELDTTIWKAIGTVTTLEDPV